MTAEERFKAASREGVAYEALADFYDEMNADA